jgi:amino acid adenylation domain-containing protein
MAQMGDTAEALSETLWELSDLSPTDRRLFHLYGWGPRRDVPPEPLHQVIERHAAAAPATVAVEHEGVELTYGELDRHADRLAARLVENGVRAGDHVAVVVRRGIPMVVGILAILKAGAAYVPQDARIVRPAMLRHILDTARARVVLTESGHPVDVPAGHVAIDIDAVMRERTSVPGPRVGVTPDHGCYVLFTSGTTGRPNGVAVTHANTANLILSEPGDLGIRPGTVVGQILNIAFDMAAWEILGCLVHGGTLLIRGDDIQETARRVDVLIATPTILSSIDPDRCPRVRTVAVAGEPCPRPLADRWARVSTFYNACGPTEVTIVNTMGRHRAGAPVTIGSPTPNNTVYVLDEHRRPCPIGEIGEMWAGGDCVSAGYLANPGLNAERYVPDPFLGGGRLMFRTRDLGRWTTDGQLEHLGRTDDQVKVRGFRVELDSVSAVLENSVADCTRAATLKLDDRTIVAFVQPETVDPVAAARAVAAELPYYCVPAAVYPMPTLPVTGRGKIDKALLLRIARGEEAVA